MFTNFLWFEVKYRMHSISTYVYFAIWFFMMMFSVSSTDFGPVGPGKVLLNGPFGLSIGFIQLTAFGTFIISALFGTAILRDFREDTYQLIFTKPISKFAYLGGRWAGSVVVSILVFSGLILGAMFGTLMPWADKSRLAPLNLWFHLQPFLSITLIQILFLGSLFFMVAALTRRLVIVYLQGVILFAIYLIGAVYVATSGNLDRFWPSVLDPLGLILFQSITRYWTVVEKNTQLLTWSGSFLYNRLLWLGVGLASLLAVYVLFPMSAEALTARRGSRNAARRKTEEEEDETRRPGRMAIPIASRTFGSAAIWPQLVSLTRLRFLNIVREVPFWAIALIMIVLSGLNAHQAGRFRDTAVWPVTYLMTQVLQGVSSLFLYIVATLYAGELIWRERDVHFDQIHDSLPLPTWVNWLSQFLSLVAVEALLLISVMLCGIGSQAVSGYYNFEIALYFKELFLVAFPSLIAFMLYAFFWQTVVANKFMGHAIVIGTNLVVPIMYRYGFENRLYLLGETSPYTYSDMNGYGHFVPAVFWSTIYWLAFMVMLGLLSIALTRRGTDLAWASRWKTLGARSKPLLVTGLIALLVFVGSGAWFYYNTHVLNEFRTAKLQRQQQAAYERTYKKYEMLPQPKVSGVDVNVNIYPERRSFDASGSYTLVNHTSEPIPAIHVTGVQQSLDEIKFDRPFHQASHDSRLGYWIFNLDQPVAPGESIKLSFRSSYTSKGFRDANNKNELAYNGTFFDRDYFPLIGYARQAELSDPQRRREENLPLFEEMAPRGDPYYSNVNLFTPDSDWITFHSVVSTSPDQIALAPGYLKREWTSNGRRYFEYEMGDTKINNFFSFISGRYAVKRDQWKNVKLEIYYHPGHEYNLNRMLQSAKKGLEYLDANFAPYQFQQFRILEFPRYRTFAQSFPNTVPYSEALGFIQRVQKKDDLDEIFYVTAHELAHQWWGHQLIGGMTQGSNMMSESLAQYSALMIMEKEYGADNIRKFLKHELDAYLRGRGGELRKEPPLALVQNEPYVWYNKGSLVMYSLRDYLGEDRLNGALRKFLLDKRYAKGPFPDTRDFVAYLREATPPDMQYLITDMLESIVLYDNKAVAATWTKTADNKYKVLLTLDSRKLKADGSGLESEIPVNDLIDVGVFSGDKDHEKALYLAKHRFTGKQTKVEVIVDSLPTRAGIDPYHKLIDRKPDDNVVDVGKT